MKILYFIGIRIVEQEITYFYINLNTMSTKKLFYVVLLQFVLSVALSQNLKKEDFLPKLDIILVGTNDIHGTAYPTILSRKDTAEKYTYGGLIYMANIIQTIKQQNNGNILYLDAGDQFQGGLEASKLISSGQIVSDYFNHMNAQATAIGNHEFDFGAQFLTNYLSKLNNNVLSSNFVDTAQQQLPLKKQQKSKIYKFIIKDRSPFIDQNFTEIKIGVIGLSTVQTPYTSSGFVDGMYPATYKFQEYKAKVLQEAQHLKSQGAHALILVNHVGNQCNNNSDYGLWSMKNQQANIPCRTEDELFKLIDQLPNGMIDAVVQGHRHTQSHYFYKGVPIIGTVNGGYYLNTIRLRFSLSRSTAFLQEQDMLIEGPIPVCARIFQGTNKCEYVAPQNLKKAGELIQWKFHGKKVEADPELAQIYQQKYAQKMKQYEYEIANNYIPFPLIKDYSMNSSVGNLITNVIANSIKRQSNETFDFVVLNGGGFRTTWYPGVVRYAELHSMFPFDNQLVFFRISGRDLKQMLEILQNGKKRYYPTWGLQQLLVKDQSRQIHMENNRYKHIFSLQSITQSQKYFHVESLISTLTKNPIMDDQIYRGVTIQFLINGGDDFAEIVDRADEIKIFDKKVFPIMMKDVIQKELQAMKDINEKDLVGPNGMERIVVIETYKKAL